MAIVAEILLGGHSFPLVGVANEIPSGRISVSKLSLRSDDELLFIVSVDSQSRTVFEQELRTQPEITDVVQIGEAADDWFYKVIAIFNSGLDASYEFEKHEGVMMDGTITSDGFRKEKVFSDYEALQTLRDRCDVLGIPFELLRIAVDPENPGERDTFGLTDKQYRAMSLAFAHGYYDSPRQMTTQELAEELGISAASASDLLRRAENQLISQTLGPTIS
ncbi:HTH-10 family transcription regulator (plasmid) [Halobacterium hubeiense]|uniref:HTH-10 family transcription regulator n=1 Tax=Halobacterium hubeiense TaxID=1407499 RepID=A0A0U5H8K4_9EURY|nr:helix-turn-helix domain-containing protein [Halobacterium hubeiense]CQH64759.1 HTH-10 family transcription regulator [Halobacterium hubeiense]